MNTDPNEYQPNKATPRPTASWSPVADAMRHDFHPPLTKQGNTIDPPDPGSTISRVLAFLLCIIMVATVIVWTNSTDELKYKYLLNKPVPAQVLKADLPAPGNFGQIDIPARIALRGFDLFEPYINMSMIETKELSLIDEDYVRLIMLAGEIEGDESALERIETLRTKRAEKAQQSAGLDSDEQNQDSLLPDDLIQSELSALQTLYTLGPDALEDNQRDQLAARYGLVGRVALTHGLDNTDPQRSALINGSKAIIIFLLIAGLGMLVVPLVGVCLLVIGIVRLSTGQMKLRNHVAAKGGSVFLETYILFVAAFLAMSVGAFFFPQIGPYTLIIQWLLMLTVFWGIVRGMKPSVWRSAIGWHKGQGVFKEIGCGILAYLASVPLFIIGTFITFILMTINGLVQTAQNNGVAPEPKSMTNPFFEIIASGDVLTIALLFMLATIWAPIVEEAIFRGSLFRQLRSSMHWIFAALLSALLFAFMHSYGPLMVSPLIALGFMFAFMREWRGSLIAPMTAHFLHNFTIIGMTIFFVTMINGPS